MPTPAILRLEGDAEFASASRSPLLNELSAILTGRERSLLPLKDVVRAARAGSHVDRGVHEIPLALVRGTEGRTRDFDASFHPLQRHLRERWTRLYTQIQLGREMPPIEVYRVGEVYFVRDGHHRVSIARRLGWESIRAHVIEVRTRAPLAADVDSEDLLRIAEYACFLERTQLDRTRPEARIDVSHLGCYDVVLEHVEGHRYFLGLERGEEVPLPEAAASWYDTVYRPVSEVAERHRLADQLPGWSEADRYLALTRLWLDLQEEGCPAGPEDAARALLTEAVPRRRRWTRPVGRLLRGIGRTRRSMPGHLH